MWGASWDITSHLLRTPETFFTPSHGVLYLGVGISVISAILGLTTILIRRDIRGQSLVFGSKVIIVGTIMQIIAGPGDFYWHELFGIDGLLSPTVITSYSIHYTKLYDWHEQKLQLKINNFFIRIPFIHFKFISIFKKLFRITSYNVCYTKLLRNT